MPPPIAVPPIRLRRVRARRDSASAPPARRAAARWIGVVAAALILGSPAAAWEGCEPLPGEPAPLPRVDHEDPVLAGWARARAAELGRAGRALEPMSLWAARETWRRLRCLDPGSSLARAGLYRTGPAWVRPPVRPEPPDPRLYASFSRPATRGRLPAVSTPPPGLGVAAGRGTAEPRASVAVLVLGVSYVLDPAILRPLPPPPDPGPLRAIDRELDEIERLVQNAHFRTALALCEATSELVERLDDRWRPSRQTRLSLLAASAAIALGRAEDARAHMQRALIIDPQLALDPAHVSPKLRSLLAEARSRELGATGAPAP